MSGGVEIGKSKAMEDERNREKKKKKNSWQGMKSQFNGYSIIISHCSSPILQSKLIPMRTPPTRTVASCHSHAAIISDRKISIRRRSFTLSLRLAQAVEPITPSTLW
jgi:hypothetical protein